MSEASEKLVVPIIPIDRQSCGVCVAFQPGADDKTRGVCRFYPPAVVMTIPLGGATYSDPESYMPEVEATDWCAQWRPML